jgi:hypothetical protein
MHVMPLFPPPEPWQVEDETLLLPPGARESQVPGQAGDPPPHDTGMPDQLS